MAKRKTVKRILATVCFECCNTSSAPWSGLITRSNGRHPKLGEKVDLKWKCKGCPIGVMRGDGAPISKGNPDPVFTGQLIPGDDCIGGRDGVKLCSEDFWRPCEKCEHAEILDGYITLKDLNYCLANCPAKEILDALQEREAEARMS